MTDLNTNLNTHHHTHPKSKTNHVNNKNSKKTIKKLPIFVYLCDTTMLHTVWQLIFEYPKKYSITYVSNLAIEFVYNLENKFKDYHFFVKDIVLKPFPPPFLAINRNCASYYRINIVKKHKTVIKPKPPLKLPPIKPKQKSLQPLLTILDKHKKSNFPVYDTYQ